MKKILVIVAAVFAAFVLSAPVADAQTKLQKKEAKRAAKVLEKEGWKSDGGAHTIEYYLLQYYALEAENELVQGRSADVDGNTRVAADLAKQNAAQEYVRLNTSYFKGVGAETMGKMNGATIDDIENSAISQFEGAIDGKLSVSFLLFKETNGKISCIAYCYINKAKAEELRKEAIENATDDAERIGEHYESVKRTVEGE